MIKRFAILLGLAAASLSAPAVVRSLQADPAPAPQAGIRSDTEFDRLARTEGSGRFLALPQLMFAIDRAAVPPRALWIDTKRYRFHLEYLQAKYLTLADSETFNAANYSNPKRRFLLGSVVRYPRLNRYGVELWEGDVVEPALLADMMRLLQAGFHAPLTFKPNSDQQREAASEAKLPTIGIDEAYGSREELILNHGRAVGRLVVVKEGQEDALTPRRHRGADDHADPHSRRSPASSPPPSPRRSTISACSPRPGASRTPIAPMPIAAGPGWWARR